MMMVVVEEGGGESFSKAEELNICVVYASQWCLDSSSSSSPTWLDKAESFGVIGVATGSINNV